jgi:hypothetical protein
LTAADAKIVEGRFQAKLSAIGDRTFVGPLMVRSLPESLMVKAPASRLVLSRTKAIAARMRGPTTKLRYGQAAISQ